MMQRLLGHPFLLHAALFSLVFFALTAELMVYSMNGKGEVVLETAHFSFSAHPRRDDAVKKDALTLGTPLPAQRILHSPLGEYRLSRRPVLKIPVALHAMLTGGATACGCPGGPGTASGLSRLFSFPPSTLRQLSSVILLI